MRRDAVSVTRIAADPERVYEALTTRTGLTGWWTTQAEVGTRVGETIRFKWSTHDHTTVRIDKHELNREVRWTCVEQRDGNLPQPDEWVGTSISFEITPVDDGCALKVTHEGLLALDCGDMCSNGWATFMAGSLKPLVELGAGNPWTPRD
jgi:uncharacterized protein YndB with AHSA1/START domain